MEGKPRTGEPKTEGCKAGEKRGYSGGLGPRGNNAVGGDISKNLREKWQQKAARIREKGK